MSKVPLPLVFAIEQGIEAALNLDPDTRKRLHGIDGCVVKIRVLTPRITVTLSVVDGRVHVIGGDDEQADTTLSGSLQALRSLTRGNDALYRGDVVMEGDAGIGGSLKEIMSGLDPDWEELISPFVGDTLAHRVGVQQQSLGDWFDRTRSAFEQNSSEYLQEEAEVIAPNSQVLAFIADVDELRAACDRLEARVKKHTVKAVGLSGESN